MEDTHHEGSRLRTWLILCAIAFGFLAWGSLLFFVIGDKGVPKWDFSIIEDVPGESPYSTTRAKDFSGYIPEPKKLGEVTKQHVMGPENDNLIPDPQQGIQSK